MTAAPADANLNYTAIVHKGTLAASTGSRKPWSHINAAKVLKPCRCQLGLAHSYSAIAQPTRHMIASESVTDPNPYGLERRMEVYDSAVRYQAR